MCTALAYLSILTPRSPFGWSLRPTSPRQYLTRRFTRLVATTGLPPVRLHDLRYGESYGRDFVWVFEISGAVPPNHLTGGYAGAVSERQPPMYFRLGGGSLKGISKPGEIVWSRIFVDGGMGNGGHPGYLVFRDNSTAAAANILNHAGVLGPNFKNLSPSSVDGFGGTTIFDGTAKAGTARVTNEGEANGNSTTATTGGITDFRSTSSADHGTFVTLGATAVNGKGGLVQFEGSATADQDVLLLLQVWCVALFEIPLEALQPPLDNAEVGEYQFVLHRPHIPRGVHRP